MNSTVLQESRGSTLYSCTGVVHGYRSTGVVHGCRGTSVVHVCMTTGVVQCYNWYSSHRWV
jgi:hypothetical protein